MKEGEDILNLRTFREGIKKNLINLAQEIGAYNRDHGPRAQGERFFDLMEKKDPDDIDPDLGDTERRFIGEATQETRVQLANMHQKYNTLLQQIGMQLSVGSTQSIRAGMPSGPLALSVINTNAFTSHLRALNIKERSNNDILHLLIASVERQIQDTYFSHPSPDDANVLNNLDAIADALDKGQTSDETQHLRRYAKFQATGRLQQYVKIEAMGLGLWDKPNERGSPADWIAEHQPRVLEYFWSSAIRALAEQDALGEKGVGAELRQHLLFCAQKSLERLPTTTWVEERKKQLEVVIKEVLKCLQNN